LDGPEAEPAERQQAGNAEHDVVPSLGALHRTDDVVRARCL
jgi:hypothetical protein